MCLRSSEGTISPVIPGHRAAMSPEPMHTDLENYVGTFAGNLDNTVFMGSGFGPMGRPGMTKVISSQTLRRQIFFKCHQTTPHSEERCAASRLEPRTCHRSGPVA
jgi:hypothetical protein